MAASALYKAGYRGRVRTGSNVAVAGITKWTKKREVGEIEVSNFESGLDVNNVVEGEFLSDNISNTLYDIEGFIDFTTQTTINAFAIGTTVTADFLYDKTGVIGDLDVVCFIKSLSPSVELKAGQKFSATLRPFNTVPVTTTTGT